MGDSISRQAAIHALNKEIMKRSLDGSADVGTLDEFDTEHILRGLPAVEPELHWTSCSERLPETEAWRTDFLVTVTCDVWEKPSTMVAVWENTTVRNKPVSRWLWKDRLFPSSWKIEAWSPLPEPWKGERDERRE